MNGRVKGIIRLIVAVLPLVNIILIQIGKSPFPFSADEINMAVSAVAQVLSILWAWWKNNNMTIEAQTGQEVIDELKAHKNKAGGEGDPLEVE